MTLQNTQKKKTKFAIILASLALVGTMAIGGISAYFTDKEVANNVFTVGSGVNITIDEPSWDPEDPEHNNIVPGDVFAKDPQITNGGDVTAYAFMSVAVPYKNVVTVNDDGSKNEPADTELFTYDVNSGWTEVGSPVRDEVNGVVKHVYVYGSSEACTALAKNETTPSVFDEVKFVNIAEGSVSDETLTIPVTAYAIQSDNIEGDVTDPVGVWSVLSNQTV